jgi:transcriptional regulator with PAS, ATPase and Fis domain
MQRLMEQVRRIAPQDSTVLLSGETGTGKSRLARLIHELSPRRTQPFRVVNCGALSASLIESELFGHVQGAFTGAGRHRTGKLAEVGRGTLLLDEIDALPFALQAKLLLVVEERVFEPVGSNRTLPLQARLIVASNRALDQEVIARRFRSDLYYRLNVIEFHLPPLRDQRERIRPLAEQFLAEFAARIGRTVHGIDARALQALEVYSWPGNIRELRNVLERTVALCSDQDIQLDDLPAELRRAQSQGGLSPLSQSAGCLRHPPAATLAQLKEQIEVARITKALQRHRYNRRHAAAELGISRTTLYKKIHKYGLPNSRDCACHPCGKGSLEKLKVCPGGVSADRANCQADQAENTA